MAKGKGKKLKDKGQTISQPHANQKIKKKKKKAKATEAGHPAPVSLADFPQTPSLPAPSGCEAASGGKMKAKNKLNCVSGFIFMCNARTKPECFRHRVFGLPAGRIEDVKNVKNGMKLFLFDCDMKLLYGVYKATSHGQMNLEPSAFGGRFPAQVSFALYEECMPLPVSAFRFAIKDNYYQGSKFKPELNRRQVKDLVKLFRPFAAPTAAPVAPMPQVAPPQAIQPPSHDPYLAGAPHGFAAPIVEPHPVQQIVPKSQHEVYRTAATMGHVYPTLDHQGLPASNNPYYFAENRRPYSAEENAQIVQDQYPRYRAVQEIQHYRLPVQRQGEYVAGYYNASPLPATSHGPPLMHLHGESEFVPQKDNVGGYYVTYPTPTPTTSHGPLPVPLRPELPMGNVYPRPATSHGQPHVHPYGSVLRRPEVRASNAPISSYYLFAGAKQVYRSGSR